MLFANLGRSLRQPLLQTNAILVSSEIVFGPFCFVRVSDCFVPGILRFKTNQSVHLAMEKLRVGEIVVQDVAVHVKVLQAASTHMNSTGGETKNEDVDKSSA